MGITEYTSKAATAWFLGFFPYLEIYVAVPSAIALGLDYVSAIFWSVLGNFTPIPILIFFYQEINKIVWVKRQLEKLKKRSSKKVQRSMDRYGAWFILILTPIFGSWIIAIVIPVTGMNSVKLMISSFLSITFYAIVIAVLIAFGINFV